LQRPFSIASNRPSPDAYYPAWTAATSAEQELQQQQQQQQQHLLLVVLLAAAVLLQLGSCLAAPAA
jgi:hypothetical protein